jgi:hypothetical protein
MGLAESSANAREFEPPPVVADPPKTLSSKEIEQIGIPLVFVGSVPTLTAMAPQFALDDDATLCRFLRARQFDVDKAEKMLRDYIEHRELWRLDTILDEEDPLEVLWQHSVPVAHIGYDKIGRPIIIERFAQSHMSLS